MIGVVKMPMTTMSTIATVTRMALCLKPELVAPELILPVTKPVRKDWRISDGRMRVAKSVKGMLCPVLKETRIVRMNPRKIMVLKRSMPAPM